MSDHVSLKDKFYGCIAGTHVGSSMGAAVEGWPYEKIEKEYGTLNRLLPYQHYKNGWVREPGTTEDGIERQKMMISAIIEKKDRINAEDLRKAWIKYMNPEAPGKVAEPFDGVLLQMAKSGVPAVDIGRFCDYACLCSLARSSHPIALINAGDIEGAINDIYEVGQIYQTTNSSGIKWAAINAIGLAAAFKPNATVDSVIAAIYEYGDQKVVAEIDRALKLSADCKDFRELRKVFDPIYSGIGMPYCISFANEVVTKAVCVFRMVKGNLYDALVASVNMGRDTDCCAAVACGLAGALTGASLPEELIQQVDRATNLNPYTNSQRTISEHADGLYDAYVTRITKIKSYIKQMEVLV